MKRNCSKSSYLKNKTVSVIQDVNTKKSSRVVKAKSMIRITPPQQIGKQTQLCINHPKKLSANTIKIIHPQYQEQSLVSRNNQLEKQNKQLQEKFCQLQESSLKEKQKIKTLLLRINDLKCCKSQAIAVDVKASVRQGKLFALNSIQETPQKLSNQPSNSPNIHLQTSSSFACTNRQCQEKRKKLEQELYRQRLRRDNLETQKKQWEQNREALRSQYQDLLQELQQIRDQDGL